MSANSRVIWSEGLFLQPQHFQQQDRHFEQYANARCQALAPYSWGLTEIQIERELLGIGKIGLRRLAGVFPDGTPFRLPDDDPLPAPLELTGDVKDQRLFIAVPLRRSGEVDAARAAGVHDLVRHDVQTVETPSSAAGTTAPVLLEVGALRTRLLLEREVTDAYACIPLARVVECRADRQVVLDDQFIPTVLTLRSADRLSTLASELVGLFHHRGETLGNRAMATGRAPSAEVADYLMLQAINRYEPVLTHIAEAGTLHPETFFRCCLAAAGEMATFTSKAKRPPRFPPYRHEYLQETFEPVIVSLREAMSRVLVQNAVAIPLERKQFGISLAVVHDRSLLTSAMFVLAARMDGPPDTLRQRFPSQVKIGPSAKIADLVRQGLPGVPVFPMAAAPRQLPSHAGHAYFELDQNHQLWEEVKLSQGIGIFVPGDLPGFTMEFWAIRGS